MITLSQDDLHHFVNALQLCIESHILVIEDRNALSSPLQLDPTMALETGVSILIYFQERIPNDLSLHYFEKLVPGTWSKHSQHPWECYQISDRSPFQSHSSLVDFMLLSRLKTENMLKLAEMDARYQGFVERLHLATKEESQPLTFQDARKRIFETVSQHNMSLRLLAEKSGLTQVSISNFKAGKDIKLSNFLKIANALGLKLKWE